MDGAQPAHGDAETASPRLLLRQVPWLAEVPSDALDRLADSSVLHRAPAQVRLFEQAETPGVAQFLIQGAIELLAVRGEDETLVELVRPFDLLLPAAVLNRQPYLLRARVREDATLLLIPAETFRREVVANQALCLAILACQAAQFRRQVKQAKAIRLRSAEERIGAYLLALHDAQGGTGPVRLPVEKRLIASQLGMTRETLSRTLPLLARHGLRLSGDLLTIEDLALARSQFPFDPLIDGPESVTPLSIPGSV